MLNRIENRTMKIGILREEKIPPDNRVPLIPAHCRIILEQYPVDLVVQPSSIRAYKDEEYLDAEIPMAEDLSDCDVLLGVKEVPVDLLIPGKTYMIFSHTIKKQEYNRELLRAFLDKKIKLIDYEVLTDDYGKRLIAFGHFAGMVGAHNGVMAYGLRTGDFKLRRMRDFMSYEEAKLHYQYTKFTPMRVIVTGTGRVGTGAAQVLKDMGFRKVSAEDYLMYEYQEPVFAQLAPEDYCRPVAQKPFNKNEFYTDPDAFESIFGPYYQKTDLLINGIYWDHKAPKFFEAQEMRSPHFRIKVIADISCDLAPNSSIPSTLKASTIDDPIFGYDIRTGKETKPFQQGVIDMMTIDNLPNELPRDASRTFGTQFLKHIFPQFFNKDRGHILERATITHDGELTRYYRYLQDFVDGVVQEQGLSST